jgi:cation diffusion facilitator family transporter
MEQGDNRRPIADIKTPPASGDGDRERMIVRTSTIGIAANILLAGFKAVVGLTTKSIAVTLDAVNNLSDALSSVVTIIGAKLGAKSPDREHPMGHGRIEYLSSLLVSAIVLYAGVTSFVESVKKVISPEAPDYSTVSVAVMAVAIVTKIALGTYTKGKGREANSGALVASGSDAMFDAVLSSSVLASALIQMTSGVSLEAYVGVAISAVIIKAGIEMASETIDDIIGRREDPGVTGRIREIVCEEPGVHGAYDLILFNYGPDRYYGSVHMELDDTITVGEVDALTRRIEERVYAETGVVLVGVSVYSRNTTDDEADEMRRRVTDAVTSHDWVLQVHGFYVDTEMKDIRLDAVISFDVDREKALAVLIDEVREMYPDYAIQIVPDVDFSD